MLSGLWPRSCMSSCVIPLQRRATHCIQRTHVTLYMRATHTLRARQETAMRVRVAGRGCTLPASSYRRLSGAARSQRVTLNERWPGQRHPSLCGNLLAGRVSGHGVMQQMAAPRAARSSKLCGGASNVTALCGRKHVRNTCVWQDRGWSCVHDLHRMCNWHASHVSTSGLHSHSSLRRGAPAGVACMDS